MISGLFLDGAGAGTGAGDGFDTTGVAGDGVTGVGVTMPASPHVAFWPMDAGAATAKRRAPT